MLQLRAPVQVEFFNFITLEIQVFQFRHRPHIGNLQCIFIQIHVNQFILLSPCNLGQLALLRRKRMQQRAIAQIQGRQLGFICHERLKFRTVTYVQFGEIYATHYRKIFQGRHQFQSSDRLESGFPGCRYECFRNVFHIRISNLFGILDCPAKT